VVDTGCGLYFWYNTLDETSQWADTAVAEETLTKEHVVSRMTMVGNVGDLKGLAQLGKGYSKSVL